MKYFLRWPSGYVTSPHNTIDDARKYGLSLGKNKVFAEQKSFDIFGVDNSLPAIETVMLPAPPPPGSNLTDAELAAEVARRAAEWVERAANQTADETGLGDHLAAEAR
jgi:hypothetical protein